MVGLSVLVFGDVSSDTVAAVTERCVEWGKVCRTKAGVRRLTVPQVSGLQVVQGPGLRGTYSSEISPGFRDVQIAIVCSIVGS